VDQALDQGESCLGPEAGNAGFTPGEELPSRIESAQPDMRPA
jgi:hypothetical protein